MSNGNKIHIYYSMDKAEIMQKMSLALQIEAMHTNEFYMTKLNPSLYSFICRSISLQLHAELSVLKPYIEEFKMVLCNRIAETTASVCSQQENEHLIPTVLVSSIQSYLAGMKFCLQAIAHSGLNTEKMAELLLNNCYVPNYYQHLSQIVFHTNTTFFCHYPTQLS